MLWNARALVPGLIVALTLGSCSSVDAPVNYLVTSESPYLCCRTIRYSVRTFPDTRGSTASGAGVVVRLRADTIAARCDDDAMVDLTISNNGEKDIFIPISHELEGDRIKLYPWRLSYAGGRDIRLARQLQYNDVLEREDALLRFFRIPAGREIALHGVIPRRWLCSPAELVPDAYLEAELNPTYYADRSRALRGASYRRDPDLPAEIGFRYDVIYTTLDYLEGLPVTGTDWNDARDTVRVTIGVKEEPAGFLNGSQQVASSNIVTLKFVE